MSLTAFAAADTSGPPNRRQHERYEPSELTYVDLGPDNGGLLLNISEGGLGFEGIVALSDGQVIPVEFKLPGTSVTIRATCQFARKGEPGRGGGLKFVDLTDEARQQIREWIAGMASRQEDSPRSVENAAAVEVADAAEQKAKIELTGSPTANREREPTLLSPERDVVSIAPILTPAPLAPAMLRAEGSGAAPNVRTAGDRSQRSAAPAAVAKTAAMEPKLTLQAAPSGSDSIKSQKSRVAVSPRQAPALTYKTKPAANQNKAQDRARAPLSFGSQVLQFAAGVVTACLGMVVIAGILLWAGYIQLPSAVASRTSPEQSATGPNSPDFQVEIVNLNNQRWMLPMVAENKTQPPLPSAPPQVGQTQNTGTVLPRAAGPTAKAPVERTANPAGPQLALQRPRTIAATSGSASLPTPSVFDGVAPPLTSPLPSIEPRAVPAAPPANVLPPSQQAGMSSTIAGLPPVTQPGIGSPSADRAIAAPAPEAAKPPVAPVSFRPAELALRVNPVYPPEARLQRDQGMVQVNATIGKDGIPRNLKVVHGDPRLAGAATAAIARWRYKPAMLDGQPVESQLIITINFQL